MNATNLTLSLIIGALYAGGAYLLLQRSLMRAILGFVLLAHGANLLLLLAGGPAGAVPVHGETSAAAAADPMAQAMALTAIVITFAVTTLLLALTRRSVDLDGSDDVPVNDADRDVADRDVPNADMAGGDGADPATTDPATTGDRGVPDREIAAREREAP